MHRKYIHPGGYIRLYGQCITTRLQAPAYIAVNGFPILRKQFGIYISRLFQRKFYRKFIDKWIGKSR